MLKHFLSFIIRVFIKHSASYTLNILGLTLGFFASIAALYLILTEVGYDTQYPDSKNIYRILTYAIEYKAPTAKTPFDLTPELSAGCPEIRQFCRTTYLEFELNLEDNEVFKQNILFTDTSFLRMFGVKLLNSDQNNSFETKNSILISKRFANKYFGKLNPVGQFIAGKWYNYSTKLLIAGIIEDCNKKSTIPYDLIGNISLAREYSKNAAIENKNSNGNGWLDMRYQSFIKITNGLQTDSFQRKVNIIGLKNYSGYFKISFLIQPLTDVYLSKMEILEDPAPHGNKSLVIIFSLVGFIILIVSCINYIILSTSQTSLRLREFGIRKTFGAANKQIIIQTISEYVFFSIVAIFCAIVLLEFSYPTLSHWLNGNSELSLFSNPLFLIGLLIIVLLTSILSTFYINLFVTRVNPLSAITGRQNNLRQRFPVNQVLIGIQLIVFCVIFNGVLTMMRQINFLNSQDLGLNPKNLIVISNQVIGRERSKFDIFKSKLISEPTISSITAVSEPSMPASHLDFFPMKIYTEDGESKEVFCDMLWVEYDFVKTFGLTLKSGRDLTFSNFPSKEACCLITQSAVEAFNLKEPIGKTITILNGEMNVDIMGTVQDFYVTSLFKKPNPTVILLFQGFENYYIRLYKNADIVKSIAVIKKAWDGVFPGCEFTYKFYEDEQKKLYGKTNATAKLAIVFSIFALILSVISLYAMSSHISNLRSKEMGIRQVFGATPGDNFQSMAKSFFILLLMCNFIAIPISITISNAWLNQFYFHNRVSYLHIVLTFAVSLLVLIIAVSANLLKTVNLSVVKVIRE